LYLGEWDEALDGLADEMVAARRHANVHRTMWVHVTLDWVHFHAQDFKGVIASSVRRRSAMSRACDSLPVLVPPGGAVAEQ
jgi:hypothetical protein